MEELNTLFGPQRGFLKYRKSLQDSCPPLVPYIGYLVFEAKFNCYQAFSLQTLLLLKTASQFCSLKIGLTGLSAKQLVTYSADLYNFSVALFITKVTLTLLHGFVVGLKQVTMLVSRIFLCALFN